MAEYIEREALYKFLTEQLDKETGAYSKGRNAGIHVARSALHNREITPASDVALVVHGRWTMNSDRPDMIICSNCNVGFDVWKHESKDFHYCPSCGCKMEEGNNCD